MGKNDNRVLAKMLERLFSALVNGPSLNCRPHSSRQRVDLTQLKCLQDIAPEEILRQLLGENRGAKVIARVRPAERSPSAGDTDGDARREPAAQQRAAQQAYEMQQGLISKLRTIAEDSKTYENDTGVHVLQVGFPILSLPPGAGGLQRTLTRRIMAPLAFISVSMSVRGGSTPSVVLECRNEGADLVVPNVALLSWLEQQTGQISEELMADEEGEKPWDEIACIVARICTLLEIPLPASFSDAASLQESLKLQAAPRADESESTPTLLSCAVLGLYPMTNQGLLRDTQAMISSELPEGPLQSFLSVDSSLTQVHAEPPTAAAEGQKRQRQFSEERLVSNADPCQARAVRLAKVCRGLVVHGPPGTGKSQTITNIIGDHLARGERVLMVCDKRTALDVVMNRLEGLGIGNLCALIHDPQRDQKDLYKGVRQQLDDLADTKTSAQALQQLAWMDAELQRLHTELTHFHDALMQPPEGGASFHELMGQWLQIPDGEVRLDEAPLAEVSIEDLERQTRDLMEVLERGVRVAYPTNPWTEAAGMSLAQLLGMPAERVRLATQQCLQAALQLDATADPSIPPFVPDDDTLLAGQARSELGDRLAELLRQTDAAILGRWSKSDARGLKMARQKMKDAASFIERFNTGPLDGELAAMIRGNVPRLATLGEQLGQIERYLEVAAKWYGVLAFSAKSDAAKVLTLYGQRLSPEAARRVAGFLTSLRARLVLQVLLAELAGEQPVMDLLPDETLDTALRGHAQSIDMLLGVLESPPLQDLAAPVAEAFAAPGNAGSLLEGLGKSRQRGQAIAELERVLQESKLFATEWLQRAAGATRHGNAVEGVFTALVQNLPHLEGVLRVRETIPQLSSGLRGCTLQLVSQDTGPKEGMQVLRKGVLAMEISRRLRTDAILQQVDGQRLKSSFERYRELEGQKRVLVRDAIVHTWVSRQRTRLLAATGTRLNSLGADMRRRLTMRGERAMRLRQVVQVGLQIEGGDPLFDLRPVWMASPETVAQIFPRQAMFDVVIFDEASQCRLEEALPVLTRAKRVVVAGDPKQLPPTRFFEAAMASSEEEEIETDQDLFETQQAEIEDLLGAALNIEIEEAYLDVHYRSRNADLIEFSNQHFYGSRLQAIPGHPANRTQFPPLTLYRANGVYDDRSNVAEAEAVCRIVQDLFKRAEPPSIGIASFNTQQRDVILDKLEELAERDPEFGRRFSEARSLRRQGAYEGLFVKNLENVQGDERDHIIISTTFGPDKTGKFYRRFGPLGQAGGGRRLNVLVTRAREEVHLVTSIPEHVYRTLPPIPAGEVPKGPYLLFSYLTYAETLKGLYEKTHLELAQAQAAEKATVNVLPNRWPSGFSQAMARRLELGHNIGSDVHWGNDGFCVDLALHHPLRVEDVTIGVLCDLNRFQQAEDAIEWEMFRTTVLESQGWTLHRIWSPQFFRDHAGCMRGIVEHAETVLKATDDRDAIRVRP